MSVIEDLAESLPKTGVRANGHQDSQELALENQRLRDLVAAIANTLKFANNTGTVDHIRYILIEHGGYSIADLTVPGAITSTEHLDLNLKEVK